MAGVVVIALAAAACAGQAPTDRSISTSPASLPSCTERTVGPAFQACHDEIAQYLHVRTIALAGGFQVLDDGTGSDDAFTSTEPVPTVWSLGGEPATLWACFGGGTVTVGRDPCQGDRVTSPG